MIAIQSLFSFQANSPKGNMLKNQNNVSNESNFLIPQITGDLATPVTSDLNLKLSTHSSHNNSRVLELYKKSSAVDLRSDKILTKQGN